MKVYFHNKMNFQRYILCSINDNTECRAISAKARKFMSQILRLRGSMGIFGSMITAINFTSKSTKVGAKAEAMLCVYREHLNFPETINIIDDFQ